MPEVVYKPTSDYKPELNTTITKTPLLTGIMNSGTRINHTYSLFVTTNTNLDAYIVQPGKILFLTNLGITNNPVDATSSARVNAGINTLLILTNTILAGHESKYSSMDFSVPLRLLPGEIINLTVIVGAGSGFGLIHIVGYEIDSALLPNFI